MKRKIALIIIGCIVSIAALAAIQGYFIYNTYQLNRKEASEEIQKKLLQFEDLAMYDSLNQKWMEKTEKFVIKYKKNKISKADYARIVKSSTDSLSKEVIALLKQSDVPEYIGYNHYITSVVVKEGEREDSLFKGRLMIFGNKIKSNAETGFSQGRWQSRSSNLNRGNDTIGKQKKEDYDYEVKTERSYSIDKLERIIMGKMAALLIFSIILLCFVVVLFYLSIKNLIGQKKIADIKTDFINNITHEFQTPLATLNVAIKTIRLKELGLSEEQFTNTIDIIDRQNNRLQKLFSQVTEASLTADAITTTDKQVYGCKDVEEIIADFKISRADVAIVCKAAQDSTVTIDRFHLNTILVNLLDNAVKYGATAITVTLETIGTTFIMAVEDNGPGIPQTEQALIFDKFYRVEKGNTHNTKGLGLGLFYVKQVITAYGGTITVNSTENEGSTFIISIPL